MAKKIMVCCSLRIWEAQTQSPGVSKCTCTIQKRNQGESINVAPPTGSGWAGKCLAWGPFSHCTTRSTRWATVTSDQEVRHLEHHRQPLTLSSWGWILKNKHQQTSTTQSPPLKGTLGRSFVAVSAKLSWHSTKQDDGSKIPVDKSRANSAEIKS